MEQSLISSSLYKLLLIELIPTTIEMSESLNLTPAQIAVKLEMYGYNLGLKLNEIILFKLSDQIKSNNESFSTLLDIMKFICKDFWKILFNKQISNLRTNHRGTFVLVDSNFKLIENLHANHDQFNNHVNYYLSFTSGILRGLIKSFGYDCMINFEVNQFPSVNFNIETEFNN